jgi:hypothetical protein
VFKLDTAGTETALYASTGGNEAGCLGSHDSKLRFAK